MEKTTTCGIGSGFKSRRITAGGPGLLGSIETLGGARIGGETYRHSERAFSNVLCVATIHSAALGRLGRPRGWGRAAALDRARLGDYLEGKCRTQRQANRCSWALFPFGLVGEQLGKSIERELQAGRRIESSLSYTSDQFVRKRNKQDARVPVNRWSCSPRIRSHAVSCPPPHPRRVDPCLLPPKEHEADTWTSTCSALAWTNQDQ